MIFEKDNIEQMDPEHFIRINKLQQSFGHQTFQLSNKILKFWELINSEDVNIEKAMNISI